MMMAAAASARLAAAERQLVDAFRLADATHADRARSLDQLGIVPTDTLDRLRAAGIVRESEPRRFYLDEATIIARRDAPRSQRTHLVAVLIALTVLLGLLVVLLVQLRPTRG